MMDQYAGQMTNLAMSQVDPLAEQKHNLLGAQKNKDTTAVRKAAEEFEAMFLAQMLNHAFSTVQQDGAFSGGHGEKMFRGLMVNEYGSALAQQNGIGLADHIYKAMLELQEG